MLHKMETLLATTSASNFKVQLWNAITMEKVGTLEGHTGRVKAVCFSVDGLRIATGSQNKADNIRVWDARTTDFVEQFDSIGEILELEFNNESTLLLAVAYNQSLRLYSLLVWELGAKRELFNLKNRYRFESAMFGTDGLHVIAVVNETVQVFLLASQESVLSIEGIRMPRLLRHPSYCFGLFATALGGLLSVRNVLSSEILSEHASVSWATLSSLCFNSDGSKLAFSRASEVEIWDTVLNIMILKLSAAGRVDHISFSSDSDRIAVVSDHRSICQIFSIPSGVREEYFIEEFGTIIARYQHHYVGVVLM